MLHSSSHWLKSLANMRDHQKIAEWFLLAIAYAFVALRLYTRAVCFRKKPQWSEILLIASAFDALGLIICDTLTFQMDVMDNYKASERLSKVRASSLKLRSTFRKIACETLGPFSLTITNHRSRLPQITFTTSDLVFQNSVFSLSIWNCLRSRATVAYT